MKAIAVIVACILGSEWCEAAGNFDVENLKLQTVAQQRTRLQDDWVANSLRKMVEHGLISDSDPAGNCLEKSITRSAVAVYTNTAYTTLKAMVLSLQEQIDQVSLGTDIELMRDDLDRLKQEVKELEKLDDDVVALRRLAALFTRELEELGVDVEGMSRDLEDMGTRVTCQISASDGTDWYGSDPSQTRRTT